MSTGQPHLEMMPDPCAMSVHHRDARRQAMVDVANTCADPLIAPEMGTYDIEEDPRFETRIEYMLNVFFCDVLHIEDVGVKEETKER